MSQEDDSYTMDLGIGFKDGKTRDVTPEEREELNDFFNPSSENPTKLIFDFVDDQTIRLYRADALDELMQIKGQKILIALGKETKDLMTDSIFEKEQVVSLKCGLTPASKEIDFQPIECDVLLKRATQ